MECYKINNKQINKYTHNNPSYNPPTWWRPNKHQYIQIVQHFRKAVMLDFLTWWRQVSIVLV